MTGLFGRSPGPVPVLWDHDRATPEVQCRSAPLVTLPPFGARV